MKLTPSTPTVLQARDAVLLAAIAAGGADTDLCWEAFAKRGLGLYFIPPQQCAHLRDKNIVGEE